jgi:uncharacterized repeat protein (TIGR02543 family)
MCRRIKAVSKAPMIALLVVALLFGLPGASIAGPDEAYAEGTGYTATVTGTLNYAMAFRVLSLVNNERAAEGLDPLTMSADMLDVAKLRAAEVSMYFSHTRPSGEDWFTAADAIGGISILAENIAAGYRSAEDVTNGWMNSPGHRANILDPDLKEIGVGCFVDQNGYISWAQFFGNRTTPPVASQPANVTETFTIQLNTDYVSKVAFDSRGGSPVEERYIEHDPPSPSYTCDYLPTPTRAGYNFIGWFTAPEGGEKVDATTTLTGNVTLYAKWEAPKSNTGDDKNAKDTKKPEQSAKNKTVATYKVKFNVNKGKALPKSKRFKLVKKGKAIGKLVKAKRSGYKFKGWYTKKKGGKKITTKYKIKKNTTLYAHWGKK